MTLSIYATYAQGLKPYVYDLREYRHLAIDEVGAFPVKRVFYVERRTGAWRCELGERYLRVLPWEMQLPLPQFVLGGSITKDITRVVTEAGTYPMTWGDSVSPGFSAEGFTRVPCLTGSSALTLAQVFVGLNDYAIWDEGTRPLVLYRVRMLSGDHFQQLSGLEEMYWRIKIAELGF